MTPMNDTLGKRRLQAQIDAVTAKMEEIAKKQESAKSGFLAGMTRAHATVVGVYGGKTTRRTVGVRGVRVKRKDEA
jgi:hypothetical protein